MKHKSLLLATSLIGSLGSLAGLARGDIYLGEEDYSTWTLHGSATYGETVTPDYYYRRIELTTAGVADSAGAAFAPAPLTIDLNQPFSISFPFFIRPGTVTRGDGLTFVLASAPGVGSGGSGLGYEGLDGVAFAVDTFDFGTPEPVSPSLQILTGGSVTPVASTETGLGDDIRTPQAPYQWIGTVSYAPSGNSDQLGTLTGSIWQPPFGPHSGTYSVSAPVDMSTLGTDALDPDTNAYLGRSLYFGFTAGNGLADDGHIVTSAVLIPEPACIALLGLGGLIAVGRRVRR